LYYRSPFCAAAIVIRALFILGLLLAGSLTRAAEPPLLLANVLRSEIDVTQYLMSEKYDGVRAVWDGSTLRFRSGREVSAPAWFLAALPKTPLDGELWMGRGRFDETSAAARRTVPDDAQWKQIRYMIFELPNAPGSFAERARQIERIVRERGFAQLEAVPQQPIASRAALTQQFKVLVKAGAEGVMLHRADAPYVTGRSDVLLKLKPALDAEAKVVGHLPGRGRHQGRLGALVLEMPTGTRFRLGTGFDDATRAAPPAIGSQVTYTYRDVTPQGKPRFASFKRVRVDP
jgi:DNA ligase 1